jgi:hypothetical protein
MFVRIVCVLMAVSATVIACSGDAHNEGGTCSTANDCGGNLSCQPVDGRQGNFCCPTPADTSKETNCHPTK